MGLASARDSRPTATTTPARGARPLALSLSLAGVYPISLFVDRLADALLGDRTVKLPRDAKRTPAALKCARRLSLARAAALPETPSRFPLSPPKV